MSPPAHAEPRVGTPCQTVANEVSVPHNSGDDFRGFCLRTLLSMLLLTPACAPHGLHFPGPPRVVGLPPRDHDLPTLESDDSPYEHPPAAPRKARASRYQKAVLSSADYYLRHTPEVRDDCSGYVCSVLTRAGIPIEGNTASIWEMAEQLGATHRRKVPNVGDLAFFDNTYDRDGNGKADDELTHIALVIAVDAEGTITLAHGGTSAGRSTIAMNLRLPYLHATANGEDLNGYLRAVRPHDPSGVGHLTSELFRAFATVRPEDAEKWGAALR